jgi:hypothetical protein
MVCYCVCTFINTASSAAHPDSILSGDAGMEPRNVKEFAFTVRKAGQYLIHTVEKTHAVFRIRIGSGFYQVSKSVFESGFGIQIRIQENKNDPKKRKKLGNFMF